MSSIESLANALADRYRLERELGAGGMAIVYLAHDLKHDRKVAIKVLHEDLAAALGAERFLAEIKTTAKLQHPHILPLLDSGGATGLLYYVMPYVAGESLRDRLTREKQLPLDDAMRIAREVADALGHAHAHGIIHRDVKPENILLQEGHALVADFGIALAVQSAGGQRMTQTGLSLGTPQYMSPEQAMGERAIDARADVYALGAVTYEMLTGEPPFTGATVQAIVAKVLSERPTPPSMVRDTVPPHVEFAVLKALAKLPADRFASATDFRRALDVSEPDRTSRKDEGRRVSAGSAAELRRWRLVAGACAAVAMVLLALLVRQRSTTATGAVAPETYDVALPDSAPIDFTPRDWGTRTIAVSSDASFAVYVARRGRGTELWWRSLSTDEARPIGGTTGATDLAISPGGESVAFVSGGELRLADVSGGTSRTVADVGDVYGLEWPSPDSILVSAESGQVLRWFSPSIGLLGSRSADYCWAPTQLRAGWLLCSDSYVLKSARQPDGAFTPMRVQAADGDRPGPLLRGAAPAMLGADRILFLSPAGDLQVADVDQRGRVGTPAIVVRGVRRENTTGAGQFAFSRSGALIFAPGDNAARGQLVASRGDGVVTPLVETSELIERFDVAPDGKSVAAAVSGIDASKLVIFDLASGRRSEWLSSEYFVGEPRWLRNGEIVASVLREYGSQSAPMTLVRGNPANGVAPDTILASAPYVGAALGRDTLLVTTWGGDKGILGLMHLTGGRWTLDTLVRGEGWAPAPSPNRRLVAYTALANGRYEVFVTTLPRAGRILQVSTGGGMDASWLSDRELAYYDSRAWYRVTLQDGDAPTLGRPRFWFGDSTFIDTGGRSSSLLPDGRMAYVRGTARNTGTFLRVIPRFAERARGALERSAAK